MNHQDFAQEVVTQAIGAGAHEAEVYLQAGDEFHVEVRMGEIETLTQASSRGLGLRVFADKRMAFGSTTDFSAPSVAELVGTTVRLAKAAGRDRHNGLPDTVPGRPAELELYDGSIAGLPAERKIETAKQTEQAAFDCDSRITNSEGAGFSSHAVTRTIANSKGVLYSSRGTRCGIACSPMAEQDGEKQTSYYWSAARFLDELDSPDYVGEQAGLRTVRKLGARKVETQAVPVVFDWMVGPVLLNAVFAALDGDAVHRGMSFLRNMLGKKIASDAVTIIDDALMPRGLGSIPFDGEGVPTSRKVVVENGELRMYFYDARTARKYRQQTTGNARRGFSGLPSISPTNFYLQPTDTDIADIVRGIANGFYVTETIGHGVNVITGDFSVGASGMWIRDGEPAFPVQEVTIAGNMLDMMRDIEQIGSDARFMSSVVSPTFKIAEMTVSGR